MLGNNLKGQETPHIKQLQYIAQLANYQPVASIPTPSTDFNYTLARHRYSEYQTPKIIKKDKRSIDSTYERPKLTTILETHSRPGMFPKIANHKKLQNSSQKKQKLQRLRSYFRKQQQKTQTTQQKSMTMGSRGETEEDKRSINLGELLEGVKLNKQDRSNNCYSNHSQLSSFISQRRNKESHQYSRSLLALQSRYEQEEESEQQYDKHSIPGPGSYDYTYSDFDKKSIGKRSTDVSFLSKITRFNYSPPVIQSSIPQSIINQQLQRQKQREQKLRSKKRSIKVVPFNSGSPRKFQYQQKAKQKIPGPQDYSPRFGIEEELIKKIQRHFKGSFGSNGDRFDHDQTPPQNLGPGCYDVPERQTALDNENFYFKSKLSRFE